jgi:hypothetical protein
MQNYGDFIDVILLYQDIHVPPPSFSLSTVEPLITDTLINEHLQ